MPASMPTILCQNAQKCCPKDWWNNSPSLSFAAPDSACLGESYSFQFGASSGEPPLTFWITGGDVPMGLTLDSGSGVLYGVPSELGEFEFTVRVEDIFGKQDEKAYRLNVEACE